MKRLAALVVAAGAIVGVGQAAHAGGAQTWDPVNDVWVYHYVKNTTTQGWWNPDIAAVAVDHSSTRITAGASFHRLNRIGGAPPFDMFTVQVDTPASRAVDYRFVVWGHGKAVSGT